MRFLSVSFNMCVLCLFSLFSFDAEAMVAMNASSAMRSDNFVGGNDSGGSSRSSSTSARQAERERIAAEAEARRKAVHESFRNPDKNQRDSATNESTSPTVKTEEETAPAVSSGSASEYNKKFASRFFKTISGYITIEQKNLPRKIAISNGSTIELQLDGDADTFWYTTVNDEVLKVEKNKLVNGHTIVILKAIGKGASRVILDHISSQTSSYKVLTTKKFIVIVDE